METAPKDGTVINVFKAEGSEHRVSYFSVPSYPGDEDLKDCWADPDDRKDDIELDEAVGWEPAEN